jgi:hypothetical protein
LGGGCDPFLVHPFSVSSFADKAAYELVDYFGHFVDDSAMQGILLEPVPPVSGGLLSYCYWLGYLMVGKARDCTAWLRITGWVWYTMSKCTSSNVLLCLRGSMASSCNLPGLGSRSSCSIGKGSCSRGRDTKKASHTLKHLGSRSCGLWYQYRYWSRPGFYRTLFRVGIVVVLPPRKAWASLSILALSSCSAAATSSHVSPGRSNLPLITPPEPGSHT